MDRIDTMISAVLLREGGARYTNNPADPGGPTKYGITLAALHEWRKFPVSAYDVQQLTEEEARAIYRSNYFVKPGLDCVADPAISEFLFDYSVNSGPGAAVKALQTALGVTADGSIGPVTKLAYSQHTNMQALFYRLKAERYELMLRAIGAHPDEYVFAEGWANRLDQFELKLT